MVTGNSVLQSLISFVDKLQKEFDTIKDEAKTSNLSVNKKWSDQRRNKRTIIWTYSDGTKSHESLKGKNKFKVNIFFVITDKLQT